MRKYRGKESMKSKVLKFVEKLGAARFTDIQEFIVDEKFGEGTYEDGKRIEKVWVNGMYCDRLVNPYRGYYSAAFSGTYLSSGYFMVGDNRLEKGTDGLYRVVRENV